MSAMHLDGTRLRDLLAGQLAPGDAEAIADHLRAGCHECEALLAASGADAVDGRVDLALAGLARRSAAGSDLEFARIERRLRDSTPSPAPRRGRRAWRALSAGIAAALAVAGVTALFVRGTQRPGWDGLKGAAAPAAVHLRAVAVDPRAGGALRQVASGDVVSARGVLEFALELDRPAHVALVRLPATGASEVIWQGAVGPGRSHVTVDGRPAAYPLAGLAGRQRFVAVASEDPLPDDAGVRAAASGAARVPDGRQAVSTDAMEVRVE
jgi:hypothetical protein